MFPKVLIQSGQWIDAGMKVGGQDKNPIPAVGSKTVLNWALNPGLSILSSKYCMNGWPAEIEGKGLQAKISSYIKPQTESKYAAEAL